MVVPWRGSLSQMLRLSGPTLQEKPSCHRARLQANYMAIECLQLLPQQGAAAIPQGVLLVAVASAASQALHGQA